jgi:tRNA threonylcarbamoyl adenosine modification protein (Sua5/YciO/YrdC/YwlC family)
MLDASPDLVDALQQVSTIAQALLLTPRGPLLGKPPLLIANTHLFFHGHAPHIRNMHVAALLVEAAALTHGNLPEGRTPPATLFCGDLNSDLNDGVPGVVQMLQAGRLGRDYWDWAYGSDFDFRGKKDDVQPPTKEEVARVNSKGISVTGIDVSLPCAFTSSHDPAKQRMTNVVPNFEGVLDYIWCETGRIRVTSALQVPDKPQLGGFLPNEHNPSDHLPVAADVELLPALEGGAQTLGRGEHAEGASNVHAAVEGSVALAVQLLRSGRIVALPTDTIYGFAGLCSNPESIDRIYQIKGRARRTPLALCLFDAKDVPAYGSSEHLPEGLISALLPGPVTVVLARRGGAPVAANLNPGVATVALRVPAHGFIQQVCQGVGLAIALTSANRSGDASSVEIGQFEALWGDVAAVFDGGVTSGGALGSTIVDLSGVGRYRILREGSAQSETEATLARFGMAQTQGSGDFAR